MNAQEFAKSNNNGNGFRIDPLGKLGRFSECPRPLFRNVTPNLNFDIGVQLHAIKEVLISRY